ncbi:hypothetical protein BJY00DRAFT_308922 [Aspergillus carlsbadensis]|nr:hypothetical protein BJY00DRAFT_308922 [Aspergillus carlsbadensis]
MTQPEPERQLSFRTLAELPRQATGPDNQHIRPEVWKQWTFVVEIVAVSSSDYYDTIMVVRDGDEQVLTVGFDLDELDGMQDLIETTFKTGCTLLILEAHKIELHGGKNVTGIEVTDLSQIKVSLSSLLFGLCPAGKEHS